MKWVISDFNKIAGLSYFVGEDCATQAISFNMATVDPSTRLNGNFFESLYIEPLHVSLANILS